MFCTPKLGTSFSAGWKVELFLLLLRLFQDNQTSESQKSFCHLHLYSLIKLKTKGIEARSSLVVEYCSNALGKYIVSIQNCDEDSLSWSADRGKAADA